MSPENGAILLPASRVDFFVPDAGTADIAQSLVKDWRFARVTIDIVRDGIEAAIARYTQSASPEVIVIGTEDISPAFIERLGALAAVCAAGTDAVIIGPQNDVHLYRDLVGMGVRDYLVRPVSFDEVLGVVTKSLIDKKGLSGSRMVSIIGAKGGVGVTAVTQLLSSCETQRLGQKAIVMDIAGSISTLGIAFGIEPASSLNETIRISTSGSEDDLKRIVQKSSESLGVLISGGDAILNDRPDADAIENAVNRLLQQNPVAIVDLSCGIPSVQKRMLSRSSHIVLVTTPLIASLRNARALLSEIKSLRSGLQNVDVVVSMVGAGSGDEVSPSDIAKVLEKEPACVIPYLPKLFSGAETAGKPVQLNQLPADTQKGLIAIATRAAGVSAKTATGDAAADGKEKPMGFFKSILKKK